MKINEQIAEKMGWVYFSAGGYQLNEIGKNWESVKALQAKMVEDGWHIKVNQSIREEPQFWCDAIGENCTGTYDYRSIAATEPAAIVELFKKVYGIKEGE